MFKSFRVIQIDLTIFLIYYINKLVYVIFDGCVLYIMIILFICIPLTEFNIVFSS